MDRLQDQCARLIHQDSFYRGLTPEEHRNVRREWEVVAVTLLCSLLVDQQTDQMLAKQSSHEMRRTEGCYCALAAARRAFCLAVLQ